MSEHTMNKLLVPVLQLTGTVAAGYLLSDTGAHWAGISIALWVIMPTSRRLQCP